LSSTFAIDEKIRRVLSSRGYIASCLHIAVSPDGKVARLGFVKKINRAEKLDLVVDVEPAETKLVDGLSKQYGCDFKF
jgi:hypothetical protein